MPDLREVELRIAVAEGVLSRAEADALGDEARQKRQSPLALLVERGRISDDSYQSFLAAALNDPVWHAGRHDASASTHTMSPPAAGPPVFPVGGWDRYLSVRFLGQGGMGMVFLAIDARLRREVAIKFVRGDDAEHVRRLIAEARTQARVSHERICKVYEVGEVDGKVYIAMQYIAGEPLGRIAGELTVEQKVMVIRDAAEGIHEAHRAGIIHRDIKPSNIMVERRDDGEIRPYVMDFGLARSAQEVGTTLTGAVLGTPRYMAPEQAQGETAKLDRRADVYSLGATLYHVVTGEPPVPGDTVAEVIRNLISEDPRPLRAHDPNLPVDLEAIVLKCLEKDRSARYDSARALVDDLDRFLNGEPVLARPAGRWYRLRRRLAKHRRLVAAGAVGFAVLVATVVWGLETRGEAAERERLARRFTERVERIEATALYSALSPRHDIRGDRAKLRARMDELAVDIGQAGEVAVGPGHYALGRGYLAFGDDDQARAELEQAWRGGYHEPQAAYALAQALSHLYQNGLLAAERIEDKDHREAKKREIERQYRDPALDYLSRSTGADVPSPEYVAALVAFCEAKLDQALAHLDAIGGGPSGFYEAPKLRGDILFARALGFHNTGDNERARSAFDAGRAAYADAVDIGRSVPAVYVSLGELEHAAMVMALYGEGDAIAAANRALVATGHALAMVPDHYEALTLDARIRRSLAEHQTAQGIKVDDLLGKALAGARRAVEVAPSRAEARLEMARIYRQWADYRKGRREDPSEQFRLAVESSDAILPQDRDTTYYMNLALIYSLWAEYQDDHNLDGDQNRERSNETYGRALQLAEALHNTGQQRDIWINRGINWFKRGSAPHAKDPDRDLQQATTALDKAIAIDAKNFVSYFYRGRAYRRIALRAKARGGDPGRELERALVSYRTGLDIKQHPYLLNEIGIVFLDQASLAWDRGEDPEPSLARAREAFDRSIAAAPVDAYGYDNVGELLILRAGFQRAQDQDPTEAVRAAVPMLDRAIELVPNNSTFRANLGSAHAILAAYDLEHGRDPQPSLDQALAAIHAALDKEPNDPHAQLFLGETLGIRARWRAQHGQGSAADFEQAAQAFEKAIALAPENQDRAIVFVRFCRAWAVFQRDTAGGPGSALERGRALADQLLSRRPSWPDALVLRASLVLVQAQSTRDAAERRDHAQHALRDFTEALEANHRLDKLWAGQAALAQRLAAP